MTTGAVVEGRERRGPQGVAPAPLKTREACHSGDTDAALLIACSMERLQAASDDAFAVLVGRISEARERRLARALVAQAAPPFTYPVEREEAARILGVTDGWLAHSNEEADEYGAAIRMGGKISGYDVEGLLRWRKARTGDRPKR